jgi:hypothetical protein
MTDQILKDVNKRPWDRSQDPILKKIKIPEWLLPIIREHRQKMIPIWMNSINGISKSIPQ